MKSIFKKSISLVICVALMLTAVPMMFASAEDTTIPEPLLLATGKNEPGYYHPGGYSACDKTFDAQAGSNKWSNNVRLALSATDLSPYNTITVSFWYENQDAFEHWKDYIFFVVGDEDGNWAHYPIDTTYSVSKVYTVSLDLDYAAYCGLDITRITNIGLRSLCNGQFRNQRNNWDVGYTTDDESIPDFHFSLTNFYARYIPEDTTDVKVCEGYYAFYDSESQNRDWVTWAKTLDTVVDISGCDYLSFKLTMSDIEALKADLSSSGANNIFTSLNLRVGESASSYVNVGPMSDIIDGTNEIRVPVSALNSTRIGWFQLYIEPHAGNGNVPTKPYIWGVTDIKGIVDDVPDAVVARDRADIPVTDKYCALDYSNYLQDRYYGTFETVVDISNSDYIEFDLFVNSIVYAKNLFSVCNLKVLFGSNADNKYAERIQANIVSQIKNTGWNHIVIRLDDVYTEAGFDATNVCRFYFGSEGTSTATRLAIRATNVFATVHAGDVNGDAQVDLTDLIRMKKVLAGESVDYNTLGLDVNVSGNLEAAEDLALLRQYLVGAAEI